jgi:hypothetical protein
MMGDRQQDPELAELEGRLDAAFASARPRRGFQDELQARLAGGGRGWWRRTLAAPARWPVLGGAVALLVVAAVAALLSGPLHGGDGAGTSSGRAPVAGPLSSASAPASGPQAKQTCGDRTPTAGPGATPAPTPTPSRGRSTPAARSTCR